jgi:hypothetical protein
MPLNTQMVSVLAEDIAGEHVIDTARFDRDLSGSQEANSQAEEFTQKKSDFYYGKTLQEMIDDCLYYYRERKSPMLPQDQWIEPLLEAIDTDLFTQLVEKHQELGYDCLSEIYEQIIGAFSLASHAQPDLLQADQEAFEALSVACLELLMSTTQLYALNQSNPHTDMPRSDVYPTKINLDYIAYRCQSVIDACLEHSLHLSKQISTLLSQKSHFSQESQKDDPIVKLSLFTQQQALKNSYTAWETTQQKMADLKELETVAQKARADIQRLYTSEFLTCYEHLKEGILHEGDLLERVSPFIISSKNSSSRSSPVQSEHTYTPPIFQL